MRCRDWGATSLGDALGWPQSLRTAVELCLASPVPGFVWWGADLVQLYNDAAMVLVGSRHPAAFGVPARQAWVDGWDSVGPMVEQVLATGTRVVGAGLPGAAPQIDYSPLRDESGAVAGVYITVPGAAATTVAAAAPVSRPAPLWPGRTELETSVRALPDSDAVADFRALFEATPTPLLGLAAPELRIVAVNDAYLHMVSLRQEELLGRHLFDVFADSLHDATAGTVDSLRASLERVIATGCTDVMPLQRHLIGQPQRERSGSKERWWSVVNMPVTDRAGHVASVLHRVEDVTELMQSPEEAAAYQALPQAQRLLFERLRASTLEVQRAQSAMRESERQLRLMADAVPQTVWTAQPDGRIDFFNRRWTEYTGVAGEPIDTAEWVARFVHPDDAAKSLAAVDEAVRSGGAFSVEHRIRCATGEYRWFLARALPYRDPDSGDIVRWFGAAVDIHDRREAEGLLRESESRHAFLVRLGDVLRSLADPQAIPREVCRLLREHLGASAVTFAQPAGEDAVVLTAADPAPGMASLLGLHRLADYGPQVEARLRAGQAVSCHDVACEAQLSAVLRAAFAAIGTSAWANAPLVREGRLVAMLAVHFPERHAWKRSELDLLQEVIKRACATIDRARTEVALSESEARFRAIVDLVPDVLWSNDPTGSVDWFNRRWTEYTGQPLEEALGLGWLQAIHPDDMPSAWQRWHEAIKAQRMFVSEHRIRRHDGAWRWHYVRSEPLLDAQGHVVRWYGTALDIQEQRSARELLEHQVQQRTAELRAVLDSAASAIIATDLHWRITTLNPAGEALLGLPAAQALGRRVLDFVDPVERRTRAHLLPRAVRQALKGGKCEPLQERRRYGRESNEWTYIRADGTRFPGLLNLSVLRDEQGQPRGCLGVITDLTERKALEEALRLRTAQAEGASRAKSTFLAHMSHEIRTPLNAVIGLSQLLQLKTLPQDAAGFVSHIHQAGEQLLAVVNDVLDLSRIEAGEMRLESVAFDLRELLEAACTMVRPQADDKGLALQLEVPADLPRHVMGDPVRLKQVFINLMGNAVKFTSVGRVALQAQLLELAQQTARLRFDVVDTGIGIEPEAQARIFEAFTQADSSTTRRFGGTGLGLSIVRRLVAMMDGQLELESQPGKGSRFTVTLTLECPNP